jgi:polyphosphate:AMP phosphotransferase
MFEAFETGRKVTKEELGEREADLRLRLLNAQFDCRAADLPVVLLLAGNDRPGANETIDFLHAWMDSRALEAVVFADDPDGDAHWPHFRRYWRALPPGGRTAILLGGPYGRPLVEHFHGKLDDFAWERHLRHTRRFEEELVTGGTLLLKLWLHAPLRDLEKRKKRAHKHPDSEPYWEKQDAKILAAGDDLLALAEEAVRRTDTPFAPWRIVESSDARRRHLEVVETILSALEGRLAERGAVPPPAPRGPDLPPIETGLLAGVDLSPKLAYHEYRERKRTLQGKLARLTREARRRGVATVLVFEGWDAAGKGGAIRRLTDAIAARDFSVTSIAAPTEEEKRYHYLWRFWRALPPAGRVGIFDRSWYGRVLVERVEGFAAEADWARAYPEINDFEEQLVEHGTVLRKFWLHISPDEQLNRFRAREDTPYKQYKITDEDWRNRERRADYERAVEEMVARTSTTEAPWKVVAAEDKRHARIEVLETVVGALEDALDGKGD